MEHNSLVFYVNGEKCSVSSPNAEVTLLQFLRRTLYLTGTKEACGQGGCGACTVMVSLYNVTQDKITHFSANACIIPLCYLHGMAVTTVEGIGSTKKGLHYVQCGFCTPGMVMTMYTLTRNNPNPTQDDLERALEGNLCRCTGYRPILDAFKKCCPCGLNLCNITETDAKTETRTNATEVTAMGSGVKRDPTQDVIFPIELKINRGYSKSTVAFHGGNYHWIRPVTLPETLQLLTSHPDATLVMGCTFIGYQIKDNILKSKVIVCGTHVKEMNILKVTDSDLEVGAAVTMATIERFLIDKRSRVSESQRRTLDALLTAIRWIAADQIRNVATVGGHIMSKARNHDLQTLLMAAGARLVLYSKTSGDKPSTVCLYDNVFIENGKSRPGSGEVLVSIVIPMASENEFIYYYKQPHRRGFDYAIVNAAMYVCLKPDAAGVDNFRVCYGNIDRRPRLVSKLRDLDITRRWCDDTLSAVTESLREEFRGVDSTSLHYKLTLATGFFFRFFMSLQRDSLMGVTTENDVIEGLSRSENRSAQYYDVPDQEGNKIVWQPIPNVSAGPIAAGEAIYIDDIPAFTNELFLYHVVSRRPHARVVSVDPSEALKLPGVVDYIDEKDVPGRNEFGFVQKDNRLFAAGEVGCIDQPIGAILAESRELAKHAAKLVKVTYEDLPAVFTIEEAVESSSLFPFERKLERGDVDKAMRQAEFTLEGVVESGAQEHLYLEPQTCIVIPKKEHKEMEIYSATQHTHNLQTEIADYLGIPKNRVVIKVKRLGGAFGGKCDETFMNTGIAAVAAWKHNRPVRSTYDREHDIRLTGKRHGAKSLYKVGFSKEGRITALSVDFYLNAGYATDGSPWVADIYIIFLSLPYNIPHFRAVGRLCRTNLPSNHAMRGYGGPQATLVREHIITDIARKLGVDATKVRDINMYKEGETIHQNKVITDFNLPLCTERCKEQAKYQQVLAEVKEFNKINKWKKRGVAMSNVMFILGYPALSVNQAGALVQVYLDGSVLLSHGGVEMGNGVHTKVCQVAATVLDLSLEDIHVSETSLDKVPNTTESGGSYVADINAGAVKNACLIINERLAPLKAENPNASWKELVNMAYENRISLSVAGFYTPPGRKGRGYNMETQTGDEICEYFTFGVACTQVEIDCITGEHQVLRTDIVMDIGKSLNPAVDIGQIEGGFVMGCGMMTSEEITLNPRGHVDCFGPVNYKIPGIRNIPREFNVTLLKEVKGGGSLYSAKGTGEPPLLLGVAVHLALQEAVLAARADNGVKDNYRLPCPATPERIRMGCGDPLVAKFEMLKDKGKKIVI